MCQSTCSWFHIYSHDNACDITLFVEWWRYTRDWYQRSWDLDQVWVVEAPHKHMAVRSIMYWQWYFFNSFNFNAQVEPIFLDCLVENVWVYLEPQVVMSASSLHTIAFPKWDVRKGAQTFLSNYSLELSWKSNDSELYTMRSKICFTGHFSWSSHHNICQNSRISVSIDTASYWGLWHAINIMVINSHFETDKVGITAPRDRQTWLSS